jgi:hypothetical protein
VTPDETDMATYCAEQIAEIARQERDAQQELARAQALLNGLAFARRAYEDVIAEIDRRADRRKERGHGLVSAGHLG